MSRLFPKTTISRKLVMATSGVLLIGFLLMHLAGNLAVFAGPEVYNHYSHQLISNPLIYVAEAVLLLLFVYHAVDAIILRITENKARPIGYEQDESMGKRTIFSRTMIWTGVIIILFLIMHVQSLKFGKWYTSPHDPEVRDLFKLVAEKFKNPVYSGFYILIMAIMGFHLAHAFQAALRTIGVSHRKYLQSAKVISYGLAIFLAVGFSTIPIYFMFFYGGTK